MAEPTSNTTGKRYAVVTGANKGIGFEICKQLASDGITVVLTARDENRGTEAVDQLNGVCGISGLVVFHQLDVTDLQSVAVLAEFVKSQFGKLDILVNNAGIGGNTPHDFDAVEAVFAPAIMYGEITNWREIVNESYELASACVQTNYYGAKRTTEALLPLLQLSASPRIVNISSRMGRLKNIPSESAKGVLDNADHLTEQKIDQLLDEFLNDFKEGSPADKGWPHFMAAYTVSKACMNAHTRILAKKYPHFRINCVCPGFVKTDITYGTGILTLEEGAETPMMVALLPDDGPTGCFIAEKKVISFTA